MHSKFEPNKHGKTMQALTPRERQCLSLAARGYLADGMAEELGLAKATIGFHMKNARTKLHAKTTTEAVAIAVKYSWLDP